LGENYAMKPEYCVSLYTLPDLKGREFWQRLQAVMEAHGCLLLPKRNMPLIVVDDENIWLPEEGSIEEWKHIVEEAFLQTQKIFTIPLSDWGEFSGPMLHILPEPVCLKCSWRKGYVRKEWGYEILMTFSPYRLRSQGRQLCDLVMKLCKELFLQLPCDFGFGCHEYLYEIQLEWLLRSTRSIVVPTISDLSFWIIPHLRGLKDWSWFDEKPVWFYLLSRERYQEIKPFLSNIYIEARDIFPNLEKSYKVQYIEELTNEGVFIFLDYPYIFEE